MRTLALALLTAFGIASLAHGQAPPGAVHVFMGDGGGGKPLVLGGGIKAATAERLQGVTFWVPGATPEAVGVQITADQAVRDGKGYNLSGNVRISVVTGQPSMP